MIKQLKNWKGQIEYNGVVYDSAEDFISAFDARNSTIDIKLLPAKSEREKREQECRKLRILVREYMMRPATPNFDFMKKWNNDSPMPARSMIGTVLKETRGMVYMDCYLEDAPDVHWVGWIIKSAIINQEEVDD